MLAKKKRIRLPSWINLSLAPAADNREFSEQGITRNNREFGPRAGYGMSMGWAHPERESGNFAANRSSMIEIR
jgi:hypothetical protein